MSFCPPTGHRIPPHFIALSLDGHRAEDPEDPTTATKGLNAGGHSVACVLGDPMA